MSDFKTCWIVEGTTGEYSDRTTWVVRVFVSEDKARAFTEALLGPVRGLRAKTYEQHREFKHPLDPQCYVDYTGVDYTYNKAEIDLDE